MPRTKSGPITLPLQYYTLVDWLEEVHIRATESNVNALAQVIGTSLQALISKILCYSISAKTVSNVQVFTALESVFGGRVPLRAIQQSRFRCNLPSSTFFTCIKLVSDSLKLSNQFIKNHNHSLRWSKDAKIYIQRALEWHVRECLLAAKSKAKTYWQSSEETYRYLNK